MAIIGAGGAEGGRIGPERNDFRPFNYNVCTSRNSYSGVGKSVKRDVSRGTGEWAPRAKAFNGKTETRINLIAPPLASLVRTFLRKKGFARGGFN